MQCGKCGVVRWVRYGADRSFFSESPLVVPIRVIPAQTRYTVLTIVIHYSL